MQRTSPVLLLLSLCAAGLLLPACQSGGRTSGPLIDAPPEHPVDAWVPQSTCPADFMDPSATCQPGQSCNYEDWEHGCQCECNAQGRWACTPETIGSHCPTGEIDAGYLPSTDAGPDGGPLPDGGP